MGEIFYNVPFILTYGFYLQKDKTPPCLFSSDKQLANTDTILLFILVTIFLRIFHIIFQNFYVNFKIFQNFCIILWFSHIFS